VIAGVAKARMEGLFVGGSSMLAANASRIVSAVARHRIPAIYASERYIDAGGLAVYGPSNSKFFARIAIYVDRILKGMKPGDLPIQQAEILDLTINMKTARAQGIKIPPAILVRAHRVIE
jgi:putative tryptophan/tyrosine transport system substrate-binding protein